MLKKIDQLIEKSYFPKVESVEHELKKIGLLRIILGVLIFVRFYEIAVSLYLFHGTVTFLTAITIVLIVLFILGISVPLVTLGLLITVRMFDSQGSTHTLATTMLVHMLIGMLLTNAGQYYSVDAWLVKKKNKIGAIFRWPYSLLGLHSKQSLTKVYFFIFSLYAIISCGALGYHIQDPYWVNALTLKSLLTNSYLSTSYETFRWIENSYPICVSVLSIIGTIAQSLFQFLMFILIFFKWGNYFVKWWGMQFFIISFLFINLSYLPHVEILIWIMIYFPTKMAKERLQIIYDDHCNLCKKAMLFFKKYNFNDKYKFSALSKNRELYENNSLTEKEVKTYMVGWYKGKLFIGYDLYFRLIMVNTLFWFLIPVFVLGYITGLGRKIYNLIAEHRYRLFGVCELSFDDEIQEKTLPILFDFRSKLMNYIYSGFIVLMMIFVLFRYPYIREFVVPKVPSKIHHIAQFAIFKVGLEVPIVFNKTDLSLGDNWMVIYRKESNKEWEFVPLVAEDGHRLNYEGYDVFHYTNHNSDFLYYGTTLSYRRGILRIDDFDDYHTNGFGAKSLEKRINYDYKHKELTGQIDYKVIVYVSNSSKVTHWEASPERHNKVQKFRREYIFNGDTLIGKSQ